MCIRDSNCDKYQEDRLTWWDAVDVISSSGYYPEGSWPAQLDRIERVVTAHGKPFVFLEGGCPSREGSAACPNDWTHVGAPSQADQSAYYREAFEATAARPWVRGFTFWDWPARLYPEDTAATNTAYCVFGKPAEALIKEHDVAPGPVHLADPLASADHPEAVPRVQRKARGVLLSLIHI